MLRPLLILVITFLVLVPVGRSQDEFIALNSGDTIFCLAIEEQYIHEDSLSYILSNGESGYIQNPKLEVKSFASNRRLFYNLPPYGFYEELRNGSLRYLRQTEILYLGDSDEKRTFRVCIDLPGVSINRLSVEQHSEAIISFNGDTLIDLTRRDWKSYLKFYADLLMIEPPSLDPEQLEVAVQYLNNQSSKKIRTDFYLNWLDEQVDVLVIDTEVRDGELIQVIQYDLGMGESKFKGKRKCLIFKSIYTRGQTIAFVDEDITKKKHHEHYWVSFENEKAALLRKDLYRDAVDPRTDIGYTYITESFIVRLDDELYIIDDLQNLKEEFVNHLKKSDKVSKLNTEWLSPQSPFELEVLIRFYK